MCMSTGVTVLMRSHVVYKPGFFARDYLNKLKERNKNRQELLRYAKLAGIFWQRFSLENSLAWDFIDSRN